LKIGTKKFDIGSRTFIVGVLNVTPDSFSDGGSHNDPDRAVAHAEKLIKEGADIIEVGGESTRPGHIPVDEQDELRRVLPVVQALKKTTDTPIAVDTRKAAVAEAVLKAGADLINDVMCFKEDLELAQVCAKHGAVCCITHNRDSGEYTNLLLDIISDLESGIEILVKAGVSPTNIIVDPGIGFAKDADQSMTVLRNLFTFAQMPYPLMLGASRKSFIGHTLGFPIDERLEPTLATTAFGITHGIDFVRVHDVAQNKKVAMMTDEFVRYRHG